MELRRVEQTLESHPAFTSGSLLLAVLLLASVLGMAAQSAQASEVVVLGEWPTAGRDGARSSSTAEAAPPEPFFSWYFDRSQYDATVSGNRVYVGGLTTSTLQYSGNAGRALYALDATTGNVIWQRPLYADADPALSPGFRIGVPTVQGTRVYVADSAGYLWSVNAADGSVAWKVYSGGDLFLVESSLLVTGDRIYALLDKNPSPSYGEFVLKALRTTDGAVVWETTNGVAKVGAYGNLATDGTRIFAGGQGLVAWNAANGTKLWELSPNETLSAPAVGTGLVYVTGAMYSASGALWPADSTTLKVYAVRPLDGTVAWVKRFDESGAASPYQSQYSADTIPPAVDAGLLAATNRGFVYALDPATGDLRWRHNMNGPSVATPILASDAVVVARKQGWDSSAQVWPYTYTGGFRALDRTTGAQRWAFGDTSLTHEPRNHNFALAGGRIVGAFNHNPTSQIPTTVALYALGPDLVPPAWRDGGESSLQIVSDGAGGRKLVWGYSRDLNMRGFEVVWSNTTADGPWQVVTNTAWTGEEPTDNGAGRSWTVARFTENQQNYYRVRPLDRAGQAGPYSNIVNYFPTTGPGPRPDLLVRDIVLSPENPGHGQATTITFAVANGGSATAGAFSLSFHLDGVLVHTQSYRTLAPGETTTLGPYPWNATTGTHNFRATVDSGNQVDEADETNNVREETLAVGEASNAAPSVRVLRPVSGARVSGWTSIQGETADADPGQTVVTDLFVNGNHLRRVTGRGPWSVDWNTATVPNGEYVLQASVYDGIAQAWSPRIPVTVANGANVTPPPNSAPSVAISSPAEGSTVTGKIKFSGVTRDPDLGQTVVTDLFVDGTFLIRITGTGEWTHVFDTATVPDGPHVLQASAYDGSLQTWGRANVLVQNGNTGCRRDYVGNSGLSLSNPGPVDEGTVVSVSSRIGVSCPPPSGDTLEAALYVDGVLAATTTIQIQTPQPCPPNTACTMVVYDPAATFQWRAAGAGEHHLRVVLDPRNVIAEVREDNNEASAFIGVKGAARPVVFVSIEPAVRPSRLLEGDVAYFFVAAEFDAGRQPGTSRVIFEIDGRPVAIEHGKVETLASAQAGATTSRFRLTSEWSQSTAGMSGFHRFRTVFVFDEGLPSQYRYEGATAIGFFVEGRIAAPPGGVSPPPDSQPPQPAQPTTLYVAPGSIGFSTVQPAPGETVKVYARIVNPQPARASGTVLIFVVASDGSEQLIHRSEPIVLGAHEDTVVTAPWTTPQESGEYRVAVRVAGGASASAGSATSQPVAPAETPVAVGVAATGKPVIVLSAGLVNIGTIEEGTERTVPLEVTAYNGVAAGVRLDFLDAAGLELETLTPPQDIQPGQTVKYYVKIRVPHLAENVTLGSQRILLQAYSAGAVSNVESVDVVIHKEGFAGLPGFGPVATVAAVGAVGATAFFRRRL